MPHSDQLSTGQAAKLLSVTADTVLKWIKKGKLPAVRTAGGHYRIHWSDVQRLRDGSMVTPEPSTPRPIHCWEFHANGEEIGETCLSCIVYRARALRCFALSGLYGSDSNAGTHCSTSCLDCAYHSSQFQDQIRVLVVVSDEKLRQHLQDQPGPAGLELFFVRSAYETAIAVQQIRPEYVVLHDSLGVGECEELGRQVTSDPRVTGVHVIQAREHKDDDCGALRSAFTLDELQGAVWRVHQATDHGRIPDDAITHK